MTFVHAAPASRLAAALLVAALAGACDPPAPQTTAPSASASARPPAPRVHLAPRAKTTPNGEPEPCDVEDEEGCRIACANKIGRACYNAALLLVARGDDQERRAVELFEEGCKLRTIEACLTGAERLGLAPSLHHAGVERARVMLKTACDLGSAVACERLEKALHGGVDAGSPAASATASPARAAPRASR